MASLTYNEINNHGFLPENDDEQLFDSSETFAKEIKNTLRGYRHTDLENPANGPDKEGKPSSPSARPSFTHKSSLSQPSVSHSHHSQLSQSSLSSHPYRSSFQYPELHPAPESKPAVHRKGSSKDTTAPSPPAAVSLTPPAIVHGTNATTTLTTTTTVNGTFNQKPKRKSFFGFSNAPASSANNLTISSPTVIENTEPNNKLQVPQQLKQFQQMQQKPTSFIPTKPEEPLLKPDPRAPGKKPKNSLMSFFKYKKSVSSNNLNQYANQRSKASSNLDLNSAYKNDSFSISSKASLASNATTRTSISTFKRNVFNKLRRDKGTPASSNGSLFHFRKRDPKAADNSDLVSIRTSNTVNFNYAISNMKIPEEDPKQSIGSSSSNNDSYSEGEILFPKSLDSKEVKSIVNIERKLSTRSVKRGSSINRASIEVKAKEDGMTVEFSQDKNDPPVGLKKTNSILKKKNIDYQIDEEAESVKEPVALKIDPVDPKVPAQKSPNKSPASNDFGISFEDTKLELDFPEISTYADDASSKSYESNDDSEDTIAAIARNHEIERKTSNEKQLRHETVPKPKKAPGKQVARKSPSPKPKPATEPPIIEVTKVKKIQPRHKSSLSTSSTISSNSYYNRHKKNNLSSLSFLPVSSSLNSINSSFKQYRKSQSVKFSSRIILYETYNPDDYDRHPEIATCNQLTPILAQQIKEELNSLKSEMPVHEDSRCNTHFY